MVSEVDKKRALMHYYRKQHKKHGDRYSWCMADLLEKQKDSLIADRRRKKEEEKLESFLENHPEYENFAGN